MTAETPVIQPLTSFRRHTVCHCLYEAIPSVYDILDLYDLDEWLCEPEETVYVILKLHGKMWHISVPGAR